MIWERNKAYDWGDTGYDKQHEYGHEVLMSERFKWKDARYWSESGHKEAISYVHYKVYTILESRLANAVLRL